MDLYEGAFEKLKDVEAKRENPDLDDFEEFMRKVEEVNKMVHALTSNNKSEIEEATKKADVWLKNHKKGKRNELTEELINEQDTVNMKSVKKKVNKTVINEKALKNEANEIKMARDNEVQSLDHLNSNEMSQEAFMKSVEEDAKKRSEDRRKRKLRSDAIKAKAGKAFLAKDYEKALDLYNKAIDVRKDSYVLYNNRALTLLILGLNSRALNDCETGLKLNEKNFKAAAYKGKAYFQMGEYEKAEKWMEEVKNLFPDRVEAAEGCQSQLEKVSLNATNQYEEYQASWTAEAE